MVKMLVKMLRAIGVIVLCLVGVAALIIWGQEPKVDQSADTMAFEASISADYQSMPPSKEYSARDGAMLSFRTYPSSGSKDRLLILVHGSSWHGMQFHPMAERIASAGLATVIAPDLRGHGFLPVRRGDVDYIGQLEDDLADLITHLQQNGFSDAEIVLGGHSSGGGLAVRFAGGQHGALVDRFVLLAPFLKHDAPTTKPLSGGWAHVAVGRVIGLSILNSLGVPWFNHLPVIAFNMPKSITEQPLGKTATLAYSYRMNTSLAPRMDFEGDLQRMQQPFLLLAGEKDEAFNSDLYQPTIQPHASNGEYEIFPDVNHIGLVTDKNAIQSIMDWLEMRNN